MVEFAKNLADFAAASGKKHVIVLSSLDFGRWRNIDMSRYRSIIMLLVTFRCLLCTKLIELHLNSVVRLGGYLCVHLDSLFVVVCAISFAILFILYHTSGLQTYYFSSTNSDGTNDYCEGLGWKRLQECNPTQRGWKYLSTLAEGNATQEENLPFEDELEEEDYYPSLPFAALFSCLKAKGLKVTCLLCYCSEGDNIPDAFHLAEAASKLLGISPSNFHCNEGGKYMAHSIFVEDCVWTTPDICMF
ncbi:uncharacterized protein LOC132171010 [Corylus avellana]|uniref:uncharacterized protein LOC132171010 n=1 Tax=Corylus avellana TaxID=13451 RepID=UPI00286A1CAB|nr:uncharacterized protein LOC132171010 [Corylus avellana]